MNAYDEEYDVVIDTLQKQRDRLWNMTQSNMNMDMMNVMDDIRLEQISQLEKAMAMWTNRAIQSWLSKSDKIEFIVFMSI